MQAMTEYAILPLGSQYIHERAPYVKSVLLFGAEKTGKTLLTHVRGVWPRVGAVVCFFLASRSWVGSMLLT